LDDWDLAIIHYVSELGLRHPAAVRLVQALATGGLWRGGMLMGILWWYWFRQGAQDTATRTRIIAAIGAALAGLVLGRVVALLLPFHLRPVFDPAANFQQTGVEAAAAMQWWSSFPSDHMTTYFALATGCWFISRRLGLAAAAYVLVFIGLPRIGLGLHYPSDILGGALMGACIAAVVCSAPFVPWWSAVLRWSERSPALFYAAAFLLTLEMSSMFDDLRDMTRSLYVLMVRT